MKNKANDNEIVDAMVQDTLSGEVPEEVRQRLGRQLTAFRAQLTYHEAGRTRWARPVLRTAGALALAALIVAAWTSLNGAGPEPTWAQVAERFASVRFLHTTVYVKRSAFATPVQLEMWKGGNGKLRMLSGHEVFFGADGNVDESVTIAPPSPNEEAVNQARNMVYEVVSALGKADRFSLESLVEALPLHDIVATPLANQDARISSDLVVFDMADETSPAWLRIWALRESRLPVRMLYWDPRTGESVDASLSYAREQPPEFYDAEAFKAALAQLGPEDPCRGYALLKDPGGRPVTPADL